MLISAHLDKIMTFSSITFTNHWEGKKAERKRFLFSSILHESLSLPLFPCLSASIDVIFHIPNHFTTWHSIPLARLFPRMTQGKAALKWKLKTFRKFKPAAGPEGPIERLSEAATFMSIQHAGCKASSRDLGKKNTELSFRFASRKQELLAWRQSRELALGLGKMRLKFSRGKTGEITKTEDRNDWESKITKQRIFGQWEITTYDTYKTFGLIASIFGIQSW